MTVLFEVFWKSGLALGAALSINLLLRKKSADLRRLVLSATVIALFAAVLASPLLPRWTAVAPAWIINVEAPPTTHIAVTKSSAATAEPSLPLLSAVTSQPVDTMRDRIPGAIPLLWFLGSILLLARFAAGLYGLRRIRNASIPVTDPAVLAPFENVTARRVMLLQNDMIAAPVTWGIVHPVILIPAGFGQMSDECRSAVLCHELAHIQTHDFFLRALTEIARALIWFQPLLWIAARQLREEQEIACDDRVLASGGRPSAYAKLLLDWDLRQGFDPLIAVGMAHRSCLKRRLYALLAPDQQRGRATRAMAIATCLLGLAVEFPLAALSFTRAATPAPKASVQRQVSPPAVAPHPSQPRIQIAQARPVPEAPRSSTTPAALFVTSSTLIVEQVTVTRQDGTSIDGLTRDDFTLTEDGTQQHVILAEYQKLDGDQVPSYYVVAYYPTNSKQDSAWRTLKIALKNNSANLNYRPGYYGPSATPPGSYEPRFTSSDARPPALLLKVEPEYSDEARRAKFSGTLSLDVDVDASGQPTNIVVVRPLGMGLDENAVRAVTRWRFRPASKDGQPVAAPVRVWVTFQLL